MKIATGKVVAGKIEVEGIALTEGSAVTVLARDDDAEPELTPEDLAELRLSIEEADRDETSSAEEVLARLASRHH